MKKIDINFLEVIGSKTNKLFPTGNKIDVIDGIECSMVDSAMPMLLFRAKDFGLTGNESHLELNQKQDLIDKMNSIRLKVGKMIGFGDVSKSVIPKVLGPDILCLGSVIAHTQSQELFVWRRPPNPKELYVMTFTQTFQMKENLQ